MIEPGHFRLPCSGETVHHLEIVPRNKHRGALDGLLRLMGRLEGAAR